jgi:hypothetical protein
MADYVATGGEPRSTKSIHRALWLVLIAPLTAIVYYAVLKSAFGLSFVGRATPMACRCLRDLWSVCWR